MLSAEAVRFVRQEDDLRVLSRHLVHVCDWIAFVATGEDVQAPADVEEIVDIGVGPDAHPRIAPDGAKDAQGAPRLAFRAGFRESGRRFLDDRAGGLDGVGHLGNLAAPGDSRRYGARERTRYVPS